MIIPSHAARVAPAPLRAPAVASAASATAIEGYAAVFDVPDLGRDVILRGAFRESLRRRRPEGVRMLFQHDPGQPLGTWTEMFEDAHGLYVRGRLCRGVARANEIGALVRDGALDGLSIGFRAVSARRDGRTGLRRLTRIDVWEISIVTFPLQPGARLRMSDVARTSGPARI